MGTFFIEAPLIGPLLLCLQLVVNADGPVAMLRDDVLGLFESLRVYFVSHQVIFLFEYNNNQSPQILLPPLTPQAVVQLNIIYCQLIQMQHQANLDIIGFNPLGNTQFQEALQGLIHDNGRDMKRIQSMYQYPAYRKQALMHKKANQFGYNSKTTQDNRPALVCPCCQLPINTVRIKIKYGTTPKRDHVAAGKHIFLLNPGSAMFFTFIKMAVAYLILRFILTDCYNLISNLTGDSCNQADNLASCRSNVMSRLSSYNKGSNRDQPMVYVVDILNLVTIVASMVFFMLYRRYQHEVYTIADISNRSQIDYSIFVENIPIFLPTEDSRDRESIGLECKYENELKDLLEQQIDKWIAQVKKEEGKSNKLNQQLYKLLQQNPKIQTSPKVMSVSLCFDLTQMEKLTSMREELMKLHKQNIDKGLKDDQKSLFYIPNQIQCLNQEYINLSKKFAADNSVAFNLSHFVGKAYVSFEYEHYREYFLQYLRSIQTLTMNGKPLKISSAAQPSDVYWFNMKISYQTRRNSIVESYLVMLLSLGLSFVLLFQIQLYKSTIAAHKNEIQTNRQIFFNYFYTIIMTTLTIAINFILALVIQRLTDLEKHKTKTDYIFSLMVKTVLAQFMNTAVIYYIISLGDNHDLPLSDNGLVMNVTSLVAVSGVIQIVLNALQPGTILRNIMNWYNYRQKESVNMFQVQLNNALQDPQFNFSSQYAYYIVNVYIVSFYSYITPYIGIILALIFSLQYWVDKYNLFQRFSCPIDFDFKLSRFTLKAFECSIFVFSLGNLLFSIDIHATKQQSDYHIINWVSFGLSTAYCIAIIFLPKKWFQALDQEDYQKTPYSQCLKINAFNKVYWLCNPATTFALEEDLNHKGKYVSYGGTQEFATSKDYDHIIEAERKGQYKIETYTGEDAKNIADTLNLVIGNELGGLIVQNNEGESMFSKLESVSK